MLYRRSSVIHASQNVYPYDSQYTLRLLTATRIRKGEACCSSARLILLQFNDHRRGCCFYVSDDETTVCSGNKKNVQPRYVECCKVSRQSTAFTGCLYTTHRLFVIGTSGFDGRFLQIDVAKKRRPQLIAMFARTARETHMRTSQPMIIPIITHQRERIFTAATK